VKATCRRVTEEPGQWCPDCERAIAVRVTWRVGRAGVTEAEIVRTYCPECS
jgi:hypothetical protein